MLHIIGSNLNIDAFLEKSKLRVEKKRYKGEARFTTKPGGEKLPYSYVSVATSNADFSDFPKQLEDTIRYLRRNKDKLRHITSTKGIQYANLDFGIDLRIINGNGMTQSDYFPHRLVKLAAELGLGIEVSIYAANLDAMIMRRMERKNRST
jgi:hypothetical protein